MANVFIQTAQLLQAEAKKSSAVLVSFSGGKDSLVCLDLASRAFQRIVCFYMYVVPGLRHIEERLEYARNRWGVEITQVPHLLFYKCLKNDIYRCSHISLANYPDVKLADIYNLVRLETGITPIITGMKEADGMARRRFFSNVANSKNYESVIHPLRGWTRYDVVAYCHAQKIPLPKESNSTTSGVDLSTMELLHIHDNYPDDFARMAEYFPHIEAVVWRREWYGVK